MIPSRGTAIPLTAPGPGAVAAIRVHAAPQQAERAFLSFRVNAGTSAATAPVNRILYGTWNGEDVVVVRLEESSWEICCHGGFAAISQILRDLQNTGLKVLPANSTAWLSESSFSESIPEDGNIVDTALQKALIACRTRQAANRVLQQTDGRLAILRQQLRSTDTRIRGAALQTVLQWKSCANHLTAPFHVALLGAPNVGKSSLLNALAGRERSIVSPTPGTTRDIVDAEVIVDGWTLCLSDTAGIRQTTDSELELEGIERARALPQQLDLLCCVTDRADGVCDPEVVKLANQFHGPVMLICSKSDLHSETSAAETLCVTPSTLSTASSFTDCYSRVVRVSALTGVGMVELAREMLTLLIPSPPDADTVLPVPGSVDDLLPQDQQERFDLS
ncbi:MAG: tRNA modification GTPase MnmE [Planctomycetota bacterium]